MRKLTLAGMALGALMLAGGAQAQNAGTQQPKVFRKQVTKTLSANFLLYLPKEYGKDTKARWPLMVFLHGAGERGSDVNKVKAHGPPKLVAQGKEFPFIVVSPQAPENGWWDTETLNALLDSVMKGYRVDADRVYLTGLSMGGFGTWNWASESPERFAAIAPICGGGDERRVRRARNIPTWAFHGAKDEVVPLKASQEMVDALQKAGGDVKLTVYPEAGHDSWTETYNNPELYAWFLSHRRTKPANPRTSAR